METKFVRHDHNMELIDKCPLCNPVGSAAYGFAKAIEMLRDGEFCEFDLAAISLADYLQENNPWKK